MRKNFSMNLPFLPLWKGMLIKYHKAELELYNSVYMCYNSWCSSCYQRSITLGKAFNFEAFKNKTSFNVKKRNTGNSLNSSGASNNKKIRKTNQQKAASRYTHHLFKAVRKAACFSKGKKLRGKNPRYN